MYESSSLTIFYKYLFPVLWGGLMLASFILPSDDPADNAQTEFAAFVFLFSAVMIWLIIFAVRLRRVRATGSHLSVISFHGSKKIDYKDIQYVSEAALMNPRLITLKYTERETGESDVILIVPSTTSEMFRFKFLQEHDMTQYIREQIFIHNPNYSEEGEPSRWRIWLLLLLTFAGAAVMAQLVPGQ